MQSLQGQLLVASPYVGEGGFARSVVLLIDHAEYGALGLVLNRPAHESVRDLWSQLSTEPCRSEAPVGSGGPVAGPLVAVHGNRWLADQDIPGGLFLAFDRNRLARLVTQGQEPFRLFVGHACWKPGQLEHELAAGAWMTLPATPRHVFGRPEQLWVTALREVGYSVLSCDPQIVGLGLDPQRN